MTAMIERLCRVLHECEGSKEADDPLHAPWQNSWETPTMVRWQQWQEDVREIVRAMREPTPEVVAAMDAVPTSSLSSPGEGKTAYAMALYDAVIGAILGPDDGGDDAEGSSEGE